MTAEVLVECELTVAEGGSLATDDVAIKITNADAGDAYHIELRLTTTGFRVYDVNAAAAVGSDVVAAMTSGVQIRCGLRSPTGGGSNDGQFALWWRLTGTQSDNSREWTAGPVSTTINRVAPGATTAAVGVGIYNQVDADVTLTRWQYRHMDAGVNGWSIGFTNPGDLFSRPVSAYPIGIDDGVKVAAVDGPCFEGETWAIATRYQYPIDNIFPRTYPSPGRTHRSTGETKQEIAFDLTGIAADTRWGTTTLGVYIRGNTRLGTVEGKAHGLSYSTLVSWDSATGKTGLDYALVGNVVTVNTGATTNADRWIAHDEFKGGTMALDTNKLRTINRHTGGSWTDTKTKRPDFHIDGADNTETAPGTCEIWSPRIMCLIHNIGELRYLKVTWTAQSTVAGYFETPVLMIGPVYIMSPEYSWGRVQTTTHNTSMATRRDGSRVSRKQGNSRRSVQFAWKDGVDEYQLRPSDNSNPVPDYVTGSTTTGTEPIATKYDLAMKMAGLHRMLEGPNVPVVYLPIVPRGSTGADTVQMTGQDQMLYGRVTSNEVRVETILGNEGQGELQRISNIVIEEEL